jgi:drug/metabolite transporter (DMT)-like permease
MSEDFKGIILGLVGVAIFSLTLPATRMAVIGGLDTVFVALGRAILAALIAGIILAVTRQSFPPRRYWKKLVYVSFGVVLGFPLCMTIAMKTLPAAHGGIVLGVLPLATTAAAAAFCSERPSPSFWIVAACGSVLVVSFAIIKGAGDLQLADLLLLAAAAFAGIGYALSGDLSRILGGWQVICWALVVSLPFIIPPFLWVLPDVNWHVSLPAWVGFIYVSLFSQLIGFFAWNKALALGGVSKVGQLQLLQLFMTLVGSSWLLDEKIDQMTIFFAFCVVFVVAIGRRMPVEKREFR